MLQNGKQIIKKVGVMDFKFGSCWYKCKCKCKGHCGHSGNSRIIDEELKKKHESQIKEKRTMQISPYKTSRNFYEQQTYSKTEQPFNCLESIVVMLIYITLSQAQKATSKI